MDRPRHHFTPPSGWMNDPNGLVNHQGEYHLFYQANWPREWGHTVSRDLIHWEHLPLAIPAGAQGHIWSGSALSLGDRMAAIYTLFNDGKQTQGISFSEDNGRTWSAWEGNPILDEVSETDFRDPKVFADGDRWAMVVAAGPRLRFYHSRDLISWEPTGEFSDPSLEGCIFECPDLFLVPESGLERTHWVLTASTFGAKTGVWYWVGEWDGHRFTTAHPAERLTHGPDDYATIAWAEGPNGKPVLIGWMAAWSYAEKWGSSPWGSQMTLPREVTLVPREKGLLLSQRPLTKLAPQCIVRGEVLRLETLQGEVRVGLDPDPFIDRTQALNPSLGHGYEGVFRTDRAVETASVYVDSHSVEVFSDDGLDYLAVALPPACPFR